MHKFCMLAGVICTVMFSSLLFASFACADSPKASSDSSTTTSNPALSPTELWNFTTANITAHTTNVHLEGPKVANWIAYFRAIEYYTVPNEEYHNHFGWGPPQHSLETIYALNLSSGEDLWNFTTPFSYTSFYPFTIFGGVAYIVADGDLYALDSVTGAQKWVFSVNGYILWCSTGGGKIFVNVECERNNVRSSSCDIYALDSSNGRELWKWNAGYGVLVSYPAIGDYAIYLGITHLRT